MPKKKCCCNGQCDWCNRDHYYIDFYNRNDPINNEGWPVQETQPNWSVRGTVTTELPSIGHPMTRLNFSGCEPCSDPAHGCCEPSQNPPVASIPDPENPLAYKETLRTPISDVETTSFGWGDAYFYGDISPSWFNGINMTNIMGDDDIFFNLTFNLKIEKLIGPTSGSNYQTVIDIKRTGPAKNIRPHPDACHSYNVNESVLFNLATNCGVFFEDFDNDGNPLPCMRDFARMPRGPWPYRFKVYKKIDPLNSNCYSSSGSPYTAAEVIGYRNGTVHIGDPATNSGFIEANIADCDLINGSCNEFGSEADGCCPPDKLYIKSNQLCNQLDPNEGTPFGWEDCPELCAQYSNSVINNGSVNPENLQFFGWLSPINRYTTPEWDLFEGVSGSTSGVSGGTAGASSKRISLNVLVPTTFDSFCYPSGGVDGQGNGFGEWSFGMDLESPDEIIALENAGYIWSNGREQDGIWINKTPTDALRVLFTLDHSDLNQGKVWRVFRDWDVEVKEYVKIFNKGNPEETRFKVTVKQKVTEVQMSSMGCDCPSGYTIEDGKIKPIEPACDDHNDVSPPGTPSENTWLPCWMSNIDGPNSENIGGRISFCERGPLIIKTTVETDDTGCQNCGQLWPPDPTKKMECSDTFGSRDSYNNSSSGEAGQLYIVNGLGVDTTNTIFYPSLGAYPSAGNAADQSCLTECWAVSGNGILGGCMPNLYAEPYTANLIRPSAGVYSIFKTHGTRFNNASADIPRAGGNVACAGIMRYRNSYSSVQQSDSTSGLEESWYYTDGSPVRGTYEHLYGEMSCVFRPLPGCGSPIDTPEYYYINRRASVWIDHWPSSSHVGNCYILCPCGARGTSNPQEGSSADPSCTGWTGWPRPCPYYGGYSGGDGSVVQCPCDDPQNTDRAREGPYLFPSNDCRENIARIEGRGNSDFSWHCSPYIPHGENYPFCYWNDVTHLFGIDAERFYFSADCQVTTYTGLGDLRCAGPCKCPDTGDSSDCYWTDSLGIRHCNFCEGTGDSVSAGFPRNTFLNWKKYLCDKRYRHNYKIPVDIMSNFDWECDSSSVACNSDGSTTGLTCDCGCDYAFTVQDCEVVNIPVTSFSERICNTKLATTLNPKYRIKFRKYEVDENDDQWCYWDTTYQPNPARAGLTYGRSHIIITPQGMIP
jgi:hypothetical protein